MTTYTTTTQEEFYGALSNVVSVNTDHFPSVITNKLYESTWAGRDNTAAERLLIEGEYAFSIHVQASDSPDTISSNPFTVEINKPNASNYGQLYPVPPFTVRDLTIPAAFADAGLIEMADGTAFNVLTASQNLYSTASDALTRMTESDAVFSFSGHGWPGVLQFYSSPDSSYDEGLISEISSNPDIDLTPYPAEYVDILGPGALRDVFFVVLLSCNSGQPATPSDNLPHNLIGNGVDMVIAFPGLVDSRLANSWSEVFWDWVSQHEDIPSNGSPTNIYNCCHFASDYAIANNPLVPQEELDVFANVQIYLDTDVSSSESIRPARYGNSTN